MEEFHIKTYGDRYPVAEMEDLIYERTGAKKGETGGFFKLNPRVDDQLA